MEKSSVHGVNQQASFCELSWLGGIIDGEGCITVDKRTAKIGKQKCVNPTIIITNTEAIMIEKIESILKNHGIAYFVYTHKATTRWKTKMDVIISGYKRVSRFLPLITPYLVSKLEKAKLLNDFCLIRLSKGRQAYSDGDKVRCQQIWDLNGRGTKHWIS